MYLWYISQPSLHTIYNVEIGLIPIPSLPHNIDYCTYSSSFYVHLLHLSIELLVLHNKGHSIIVNIFTSVQTLH